MGNHHAATGLAQLALDPPDPHVLGRLDISVLVLAGALICIVAWDWLKSRD